MYMNFTSSLMYCLSCFKKIPELFSGLSYYFSGGISRSIGLLSYKGTHLDVNQSKTQMYNGWGLNFVVGLISAVVNIILPCVLLMTDGLEGLLLGVIGIVVGGLVSIFVAVVGLLLSSLYIMLTEKFVGRWNLTLAKVVTVLYFISIVGSLWGVVTTVIALVMAFSIEGIISTLITIFFDICVLSCTGLVLNGLSMGQPISVQGSTNGQSYPNFQTDPNAQSPYNPQAQYNGAGLSGLGAVNANAPKSSEGIDVSKDSQTLQVPQTPQTQQVQMFACPYCNQPIQYGVTPCPHCQKEIFWG